MSIQVIIFACWAALFCVYSSSAWAGDAAFPLPQSWWDLVLGGSLALASGTGGPSLLYWLKRRGRGGHDDDERMDPNQALLDRLNAIEARGEQEEAKRKAEAQRAAVDTLTNKVDDLERKVIALHQMQVTREADYKALVLRVDSYFTGRSA